MTKVERGECHNPRYSLIWLHGLGADGNDFVPIVPELGLPNDTHFIFPDAPFRPVTINGGMRMRAWFDIIDIDKNGPFDQPGIEESVVAVHQLIDEEIAKGVQPENIVLAGFSQGGSVAIHAGLRYPKKLGGIIGLSTFVPLVDELQTLRTSANQSIPVFIAHGTQDTLVPMNFGLLTAEYLKKWGYSVSWQRYAMAHSVCEEEIEDIAQWLQNQIISCKA